MKPTSLAIAALFAVGASSAVAQTTTDWTGFYIGVHHGGGWGWAGWDAANVGLNPPNGFPAVGLTQGIFGGGQLGFSIQHGPLVFGAEATLSAANIDGQIECGDGGVFGYICNTRLNILATLTGQIGFALDRTRIYIAGGAAWGRHAQEITEPFYAYGFSCPSCYSWGATTELSWGWTVGLGSEWALSHGLSFRTDYRYVRFPTRAATLTSPFWVDSSVSVAQAYHLVSFGLNYRFGHGDDMPPMSYGDENGNRWDIEFGQRAWLTLSSYAKNLYATAITPAELVSRLTYGTSLGGTGEGFYRAESPVGFYFAGLLGAGVTGGGLLIDEDFPPYVVPYSRTESTLSGGRFSYAVLDFGWEFDRPRGSIGAFVGVTGILERYQSYGCVQTATSTICVPSVPAGYDTISETAGWAGLRVGLAAEVDLAEAVSVRGEGAYLPLVYMGGYDNHWLRPDINPVYEYGRGAGFQLESAINVAVSEQFSIGLGGRYWQVMTRDGGALFSGGTQPLTAVSRHYGAFLEFTYGLGE